MAGRRMSGAVFSSSSSVTAARNQLLVDSAFTCQAIVWYVEVWYSMVLVCGMAWSDMVWYGIVQFGMVWLGSICQPTVSQEMSIILILIKC